MSVRGGVSVGDAGELGVSPKAIQDFYRAEWPRRLAFEDDAFHAWQFIDPPGNDGLDRCCVAIDGDGAVLGVMGLGRRDFFLNKRLVKAAELTTWVVSSDAARLGVGGRIMRYLQDRYDLLAGMGITDAALSVYLRSNFRLVRAIPRMIRIFDTAAFGRYLELQQLGGRLCRMNAGRRADQPQPHARACDAADLADLSDAMLRRVNGFRRSASELAWRYDDHPIFDYQAFRLSATSASGGPEGDAGVVLRIDEVAGRPFVHVLDVFGTEDSLPLCVAFIDRHSDEVGAIGADFFCVASAVTKHFRGSHWFSGNDDDFIRLIHLFHPPELRHPATTSLVVWTRHAMVDLMDTGLLYVTKQDMDFDRPTLHYIQQRAGTPEVWRC
jgi:hypothetical protein